MLNQQIMQLRAVGFLQKEIAAKFNCSQSAVSQRVKKIRALYKESLKEMGYCPFCSRIIK